MNCDEVRKRLSDHIDGRPGVDAGELGAHLGSCLECRGAFEEMMALRTRMEALKAEGPAESYFEGFPARVRERIARRSSRDAVRSVLVYRLLPAAAGAAGVLVAALLLASHKSAEKPAAPPAPTAGAPVAAAGGEERANPQPQEPARLVDFQIRREGDEIVVKRILQRGGASRTEELIRARTPEELRRKAEWAYQAYMGAAAQPSAPAIPVNQP